VADRAALDRGRHAHRGDADESLGGLPGARAARGCADREVGVTLANDSWTGRASEDALAHRPHPDASDAHRSRSAIVPPPEHVRAYFRAEHPGAVAARMGRLVELATARLEGRSPPIGRIEAADLTRAHFAGALPEIGSGLDAALTHLESHALPLCRNKRAPTYLAHIDLPPTDASVFAGLLIRSLAEDPMTFASSRAGTFIEEQAMTWLRDLVFPREPAAAGVATSGGTQGTLLAFLLHRGAALAAHGQDVARVGLVEATARAGLGPLRIFTAAHCHPCVLEAARYIGIGRDNVVQVPSDREHRMDLGALERALEEATHTSAVPMAVVLTAGTPGVGAIDPIRQASALARRHGARVHVDAAHGGMLLFSDAHRSRLAGIEEADTVVLDPHKVLGLNQGLGALLVRETALLEHLDKERLPYFSAGSVPDRGLSSLDGTRPLNALGAWLLLRSIGRRGYASIVDYLVRLTEDCHVRLRASARFEVLGGDPQLNMVLFRLVPRPGSSRKDEYRRNVALLQAVNAGGEFAMSSYRYADDALALRAVFVNPATEPTHVARFVEHLESHAALEHP